MKLRIVPCLALAALVAGCGAHSAGTPPNAAPVEDAAASRPAKWWFDRGEEAASRGDGLRAEQYLTAALDKGYPRDRVTPVLLRACISGFRLRAALGYAEPELLRHPEDSGLRYLVATLFLGLGETSEARAALEELLRKDARHAEAHYLLGTIELERSSEEAESHFRSYLELEPEGEHANEVRGRLADLSALGTEKPPIPAGLKRDRPRRDR